jgi:hypothetical protein
MIVERTFVGENEITFDNEIFRARISNDTGRETGRTTAFTTCIDLDRSIKIITNDGILHDDQRILTPVGDTFSANFNS